MIISSTVTDTKERTSMTNNSAVMLSTSDNPFNPFIEFDEWLNFDLAKGYDCCGKLARLTTISDSMTEKETNDEISQAIDNLVAIDPLNLYIKVSE